jgi:hypothetical protein
LLFLHARNAWNAKVTLVWKFKFRGLRKKKLFFISL